jgi:hypothetical protein
MHLTGFDRFVWAASFYGHLLLLLVLVMRRRARLFPAFTSYIVENVAATIILYLVFSRLSFTAYRDCYLSLGLLNEFLQLLVVYELATHVFRPTGVWARDVHSIFVGAAGVGSMVALLLTCLAHPAAQLPIQTLIVRSDFFSAVLMTELFVSMVVLSSTAGLPWKTHVARVAQGLGAYSIFCVATEIVVNYVGLSHHGSLFNQLSHLQIAAYLGCEAFWIVMLWQEAPAPRELPESMRMQIYVLQKRVEYDLIKIRTWRGN